MFVRPTFFACRKLEIDVINRTKRRIISSLHRNGGGLSSSVIRDHFERVAAYFHVAVEKSLRSTDDAKFMYKDRAHCMLIRIMQSH